MNYLLRLHEPSLLRTQSSSLLGWPEGRKYVPKAKRNLRTSISRSCQVSILAGHKAEYKDARPGGHLKHSHSRTRTSHIIKRPDVKLSSQVTVTPWNIAFSIPKRSFLGWPEDGKWLRRNHVHHEIPLCRPHSSRNLADHEVKDEFGRASGPLNHRLLDLSKVRQNVIMCATGQATNCNIAFSTSPKLHLG